MKLRNELVRQRLELLEIIFFMLSILNRISKKFGLTEEEMAYCCFIFIHLFFLVIFTAFLVDMFLEISEGAVVVLGYTFAIPLFLGAVVALIIGVYIVIKNWRNWKLRLLIILPLCLFAIYKIFDSMSPNVFGVLFIIYCIVMVLLPSRWLITSRRSQADS